MKTLLFTVIFSILFTFQTEANHLNDEDSEIYIRVEMQILQNRTYQYAGDEILVRILNRSSRPVYIIEPSGISSTWRLQKMENGQWRTLNTTTRRFGGTMAVRYSPIEPGQYRERAFPYHALEELGKEISGVYRYIADMTTREPHSDSFRIYSPEFEIR